MTTQYKGASRQHEIKPSRRRKDTRLFGQKFSDFFNSGDGAIAGLIILIFLGVIVTMFRIPFGGELVLFIAWIFRRSFVDMHRRSFDFPYRIPQLAKARDGSTPGGKSLGGGITLLGNDLETKEQIYAGNSDLRTHMLVLGTTGSGKTELLLGIVFNALIQNTGFIYVDGKGDPNLQKQIFRLARLLGREDDILIINFITSGRDFVEKQVDKVTNNMNIMGNTSSGMLIELIVSLMDDSGGGGDMWKGRAISFVAALTRPLTYLRDKGYINLSPEKYLEYFELNVIEELVWEHNGKYGENFDMIVAPLRSYLVTLPGYQKAKMKKQETKTLEQHGYIVMQLTRIFNDLTFNYGHIFKTRVGDVDFFDVVINRRLLVVLLPALERAPDSLRMLGKMIVGSIKQMMAGCLGNRVEGVVREIIDSRPTNAVVPFYTILDEYGYYAVIGFAVAPAQARSLGFCVIFAAQDFSSLKKSSAEEADATWENTNIRAVGRITSGTESETWKRIQGAASDADEAVLGGFDKETGGLNEVYLQQKNISIQRGSRVAYDDFAMQENGEFTFLIGKKEKGGKTGGVRIIRGMGFYTAGKSPKDMRINDLLPIESPEPADLPQNRKAVEALIKSLVDGSFPMLATRAISPDPVLSDLSKVLNLNHERKDRSKLGRVDASFAALGWFLNADKIPVRQAKSGDNGTAEPSPKPIAASTPVSTNEPVETIAHSEPDAPAPTPTPADDLKLHELGVQKSLAAIADLVNSEDVSQPSKSYESATPVKDAAEDEDEITISAISTSVMLTSEDHESFKERAQPILRQFLYMIDDVPPEEEWIDDIDIARTDKLLELEIATSGIGFTSMEDKWAAEDRINQYQKTMAEETEYIDAGSKPKSKARPEVLDALIDLSQQCEVMLKQDLSD